MDIDKKAKEITTYNFLHEVEEKGNCKIDYQKNNSDKKTELSKYINKNYDNMRDEDIKKIVLKCMSMNDMRRTILRYELINYKDKSQKEGADRSCIQGFQLCHCFCSCKDSSNAILIAQLRYHY